MMENKIVGLTRRVASARNIRLFLDYDGTLAEFADSPDTILPDPALIKLMELLVAADGILPAVISGRRLSHIRQLLPVAGLLLGGTYGIEMQLPDGSEHTVLPVEQVRPTLDRLLPRWQALIANRSGYYLEDKGWTLALHGRFADPADVQSVMAEAVSEALDLQPGKVFRLMQGDRFLELSPVVANKATSVKWVMEKLTPADALPVYIGDDDKDEEAFTPVLAAGGYAVRVAANAVETSAQYHLPGPSQVRVWLKEILAIRNL